MGDYTNNWSGRLSQKIHPYQEATRPEAWKLAEWLFGHRKPTGESIWWLLIKGNHDLWSTAFGTGDPLDWMERGAAVLEDWQATISVEAGGKKFPIWIAHDFKGTSIYNPIHGPMRKAKFTGLANLYVCGDKHNWAIMELEDQERPGDVSWAVRCRGYKYVDSHADRLGFGSQQYGATVTAIIDPSCDGPTAIRCFPDLEEAAEFLTWKRRKL